MSAIDTFRRAMRRHEKRAQSLGISDSLFAHIRLHPQSDVNLARVACEIRGDALIGACGSLSRSDHRANMTLAFLYDRAADAVAKLREGLAREQEQAWEDYPYVCPECHCVGLQPHADGCEEALRELPFGPDDDDDDALDAATDADRALDEREDAE